MQNHPGVFIVLEGSDGSGKSTQFRLLSERLKAVGHEVEVFKFPQYGQPSSYFIEQYLAGKYGSSDSVSPYTASIFYALDRFEAMPRINEALKKGKIVISDRYTGANMAHQGTKFSSAHEQRGFFMWAENLEFQLLGIPRPNLNLFLRVPHSISQQLIAKRAATTGIELDEHEKNQSHLSKAVAAYDLLCKLFPKDFKEINCARNDQILSIVEINDVIWEALKPLLPEPKRKGKAVVLNLGQPTNAGSLKSQLRSPASKRKPDSKIKQPKKQTNTKLESILYLQKQMLAESATAKGVNQLQLKKAINLISPLLYSKSELKELLTEKVVIKSSASDEPVAVNEIIEQLAGSFPASGDEPVKLLTANPRNEFQLVNEARNASLNYQQKEQALSIKLKNAASSVSYRFEITSDYAILLDFKREVGAKQIKISAASPRLGYVIPEVIETAGLDEPFNKAFEISSDLYGQMSRAHAKDSVYTLLLGHNVRWGFDVSAAGLSKAFRSSKNQELLNFLGLLRDRIAEHHPHVARILTDNKSSAIQKTHKKQR